ncbi:MAG TPA: type IV toxin-antitoxin system AbiEi family antitoxin domain-containing protein [Acidimicrobiales bacterium]|nr:type IV toxin-antitoxin system AbiEi family antitoxin domain-containing protein [Acidimicrobiales bacterium]
MSTLRLIGALAARQHGAVSRRQLLAAGASRHAIDWAVTAGDLIRVQPAVYVTAGAPRTWRQALMVAVLAAGPGACVSHRAAAILLAIAHRDAPELVEISVPRPLSGRIVGVIVHRGLDLTQEYVTIVDGIPCTGPHRTLVDLGAVESYGTVKDALERTLQGKLCTLRAVEWALAMLSERGRAGCGVIRLVLTDRELRARSPHRGLLEPRYAGLSKRFSLPAYHYQHKVFDAAGKLVAQIDFAYPDLKVGIEVDGFETHGTPDAMQKDFERDDMLELDYGWRIIHFTWHQVLKRPDYVARRVRQLLDARKPVLPV